MDYLTLTVSEITLINDLLKDKFIISKDDLINELNLINLKCLQLFIDNFKYLNPIVLINDECHSILLSNFEEMFLILFQRIILSEHKKELLIKLDHEIIKIHNDICTCKSYSLWNLLIGFLKQNVKYNCKCFTYRFINLIIGLSGYLLDINIKIEIEIKN
jgi:hypothetical protein